MSKSAFDRILNLLLVAAAVAVAGVVVYRQLMPTRGTIPVGPPVALAFEPDWRDLLDVGRRVSGDDSSSVQLVEFLDLECPACLAFDERLAAVRKIYEQDLAVTYVHFPLPLHRHAALAARAAECALPEGRFEQMVSVIMQNRDSLSAGRWTAFARSAGVADLASFERCWRDTSQVLAIVGGLEAAERFGVRATPTIFVNGWRFSDTPTSSELRETIESVRRGRKPKLAK